MSLFFAIIEVKIEEQYGRVGIRMIFIEYVLKDRRAENGLTAARNPMQPKERSLCISPVRICIALDEPRAGFCIAVF